MCDVYQGAHVCIAALGSTSSDQGMFATHGPLTYTPLLISSPGEDIRLIAIPSFIGWHGLGKSWPLHTDEHGSCRERVLAPRTIGFCQYLRWECRERRLTEMGR